MTDMVRDTVRTDMARQAALIMKEKSSQERLAAVAANVQNLADFTKYANEKGVATGLLDTELSDTGF